MNIRFSAITLVQVKPGKILQEKASGDHYYVASAGTETAKNGNTITQQYELLKLTSFFVDKPRVVGHFAPAVKRDITFTQGVNDQFDLDKRV